jgi:hypothetical protein
MKNQTPATTVSPIMEAATRAAFELRSARHSYEQAHQDILKRLERSRQDVEDSSRYGTTMGGQAGNIVTALREVTSNMRLDLLVRYASEIDANQKVLDVYMNHLLTEDEKARIEQILSI